MAKKKILLLSDDLRLTSGIATVSRDIVLGTAREFDWVQVGAAIIGPTVKGPVGIPTIVTSYSDYSNKFGTTLVNSCASGCVS